MSLIAVGVATCLFYVWLLWRLALLRKAPRLSRAGTAIGPEDFVSVVIAARNEANTIEGTLRGLLAQEGVQRIILVDDHSSDHTMLIAGNLAEGDPRLCVCQAPPLPGNWVGKNHALHYGAQQATSAYILFADADVILSPDTVAMAVRAMKAEQLDHLSGYFCIQCKTVGEEICAPVQSAGAALTLFTTAKTRGAATGAFNLIRTEFYRRMGGHEQIKGAIVDDVFLARLVKTTGGRSSFVDLADRVHVRLFNGFRGFTSAVARSAFAFMKRRCILLMLAGAGLCSLGIISVALPVAGVTRAANSGFSPVGVVAAVLGCMSYTLGLVCICSVRRYHTGRMLWGIVYPLPIVLLGAATFWAGLMGLLGCRIHWRGRQYGPA